MEIVALITARGGSKGIPCKNIKQLADKPLIAWTIQAALESSVLNRIIVSTDDDKIAKEYSNDYKKSLLIFALFQYSTMKDGHTKYC